MDVDDRGVDWQVGGFCGVGELDECVCGRACVCRVGEMFCLCLELCRVCALAAACSVDES